jgi:hypothetical protein
LPPARSKHLPIFAIGTVPANGCNHKIVSVRAGQISGRLAHRASDELDLRRSEHGREGRTGHGAEITATPPGAVFSMSLAATEQAFGGAIAVQTARFDQVFKAGLAKHDNFFAASEEFGSLGISKLAKENGTYPNPTVWWPASSPYVVSVGGTQLQDGWTWNPSSNDAFTATGDFNPAYWAFTNGGHSEAVWNESWARP